MWDFLDIDWNYDAFAPPPTVSIASPVAPAPIVQQPAPIVQQPAPIVQQPAPAVVNVAPPPVVQPIPAPAIEAPPMAIAQPVIQPAPIVQQPTGIDALRQTQNLTMVAAPTQPVNTPAPRLSAVEQSLFNRNIPNTYQPSLPVTPPRTPLPVTRTPAPVARPPAPVARPPAPVARPAPVQARPMQTVATSVAQPRTLTPRMATTNEITIQKPRTTFEDTYKQPAVKLQGRITPTQARNLR